MSDRYQVIEKVEDYWRQAGLASSDVAEMKAELRQHLVDAEFEGHSVTDGVGDTAIFAETWAEAVVADRSPPGPMFKVEIQRNGANLEGTSSCSELGPRRL